MVWMLFFSTPSVSEVFLWHAKLASPRASARFSIALFYRTRGRAPLHFFFSTPSSSEVFLCVRSTLYCSTALLFCLERQISFGFGLEFLEGHRCPLYEVLMVAKQHHECKIHGVLNRIRSVSDHQLSRGKI